MINEKKEVLRSILESADGIHLTVYLTNRDNLIDLKIQLRKSLFEANEILAEVMTDEKRKKFLEPVDSLLNDATILKNIKGNIGIFRNAESYRILSVPVDFERQCHVASTFHVKPLLSWMQLDRDFLFLGINHNSADLYFGNQTTFQKIDSILFSEIFKDQKNEGEFLSLKRTRQLRQKREETFVWLSEWIDQVTKKSNPQLFVAGERYLIDGFLKKLKYKNVVESSIADSYGEYNISNICNNIRRILKNEARKKIEKTMIEFHYAERLKFAKKNIFQIAKAAVRGQIKKLVVADKVNIFGKINKKTGGLALHPFDMDHEDDDILDDLAQLVVASGGEVIVMSKEDIPNGRPLMAIVDETGTEKDKNKVKDSNDLEINQFSHQRGVV